MKGSSEKRRLAKRFLSRKIKKILGGNEKEKVIGLCTVRVAEKKRLGAEERWRDKGGGGMRVQRRLVDTDITLMMS